MTMRGTSASSASHHGARNSGARDGPPRARSVPYFALSIRGHWTDSTRTPLLQPAAGRMRGAPTDAAPSDQDRWLEAAACIPYFELAVLGSVRV
jgi:hypothetical protein